MNDNILSPHTGAPVTSIDIGTRVVCSTDPNSPVMTAINPMRPEGSYTIVGWVCGWFNADVRDIIERDPDGNPLKTISLSNPIWNTIQLPLQVLRRAEVAQ